MIPLHQGCCFSRVCGDILDALTSSTHSERCCVSMCAGSWRGVRSGVCEAGDAFRVQCDAHHVTCAHVNMI